MINSLLQNDNTVVQLFLQCILSKWVCSCVQWMTQSLILCPSQQGSFFNSWDQSYPLLVTAEFNWFDRGRGRTLSPIGCQPM